MQAAREYRTGFLSGRRYGMQGTPRETARALPRERRVARAYLLGIARGARSRRGVA